jgi:hypothetical protein
VYLCVVCGSENKQPLFHYAALNDWFVEPRRSVFTARYGLYIVFLNFRSDVQSAALFVHTTERYCGIRSLIPEYAVERRLSRAVLSAG